MIRPSDLPTYLSLPDYPGVKLDRPSRQIHDPVTGQYRQLDLISKATGIEVRLVVFTT